MSRDYNTATIEHELRTEDDSSTNNKPENQRQGYSNCKQRRADLTPTKGGEPPSASRKPPHERYHQDCMPTYTTSELGIMEISRLLAEAISAASTQRNPMPLLYSPAAPIFRGSEMMKFLHKYESLAAFTSIDPSKSDPVPMFPYYCVEWSDVRDKVVKMCEYVE